MAVWNPAAGFDEVFPDGNGRLGGLFGEVTDTQVFFVEIVGNIIDGKGEAKIGRSES